MTLEKKMLECLEACSLKYPDLKQAYVTIIVTAGTRIGVPIVEVYSDGFETGDGIFHPFIPFTYIDDELAEQIRRKENNGNGVAN